MKLTITTGVRVATDYPGEFMARPFTVDVPDHELDPETVWQAGNRIEECDTDCQRLPHQWQRDIRRDLDCNEAPSLSVGDTLHLHSDSGTLLVAWVCAPVGWKVLTP